ncbi:MAG: sugar phosphate isomerase/epimerase [Pseudomonadota bacterium]
MRDFLCFCFVLLISGCGAGSNGTDQSSQLANPRPVGVQLWSVRDMLADDFEGTIRALASMGFDGVEFASDFGPYAEDAPALREFLDGLNLRASSAHVSFDQLTPDALPQTVTFFESLDVSLLIIGWDPRGWDPDQIDELVGDLNAAAEALSEFDMQIAYHNHAQEFGQFNDATFWDYIAGQTNHEVLLQLDIGWVVNAKRDPLEFIQRNPNRIVSAHYKISPRDGEDQSPIIGQGEFDWRSLTRVATTKGGLEWVVLEQEDYPNGMSSLESVAASKRGLDLALE